MVTFTLIRIGMVMPILVGTSMNVSTQRLCNWPEIGLIGPILSLDSMLPGCVGRRHTELWGTVAFFKCAHCEDTITE